MPATTEIHANTELETRGFATQAHSAGWTFNGRGWHYPIYDIFTGAQVATRFKAAKRSSGNKYLWLGGKGRALYYAAHRLQTAIKAHNGLLYIVNGEPAVLTMQAAGLENALCWFGETNVPATLADDLHRLGVHRVAYIADNDEAGHTAAAKVRDKLAGSGIHFDALNLAGYVPEKGDINDLWIQIRFDSGVFNQTLISLPALDLPAPQQKPQTAQRDYDGDDFPPDFVRDVVAALLRQPKARDHHGQIICCSPFRDEEKPSFSFSTEKLAGYDFATGEGYGVIAVGQALGVAIADYRPQPTKRLNKRGMSSAPQTAPQIAPQTAPEQAVELATFTPHVTLCERYTSNLSLHLLHNRRAVVVKAPLGTGKTELARRLIDALEAQRGESVRVLLIAHRRSLVGNLAARMKAEVYDNIPHKYISSAPRMAITLDSLHKIDATAHYDLIIMDEVEQLLRHLDGGTMGATDTTRAYTRLTQLIRAAGQVVALDGHATDTSAAWLSAQCGDVFKIENTFKQGRGTMRFENRAEMPIAHALRDVQANPDGTHVICTVSPMMTQVYGRLFASVVGAEQVLVINSANSQSKEVQAFLYNINTEINRYRVVITSPSIASGVDVTAPIAGVYGVFTSRPLLPSDMMQMLLRYRHAEKFVVNVQPATSDTLETDAHTLYTRAITAAQRGGQGIYDNAPLSETLHASARLMAALHADDNRQRRDIRATFAHLAQAEGFTLASSDTADQTMRDRLKMLRETLRDERKQKTIAATPISKHELDALRERGDDITEAIRLGHERWQIENTVGLTISPQVYDDLHTPKQRRALRLFTALDADRADLIRLDRADIEGEAWLSKRRYVCQRTALIERVLTAVFPAGLTADVWLTSADIYERLGDVAALIRDLQLFFNDRADYSSAPLAVLRRVLGYAGLTLDRKRVRGGDGRYWVYRIEQDSLERWETYVQARRVMLAERADEGAATFTEDEYYLSAKVDRPPRKTGFTPPARRRVFQQS